ncbi:MAG TPA: hypothetical protein DEA78_16150 [Cyanobacteria bacterium UBA11159]|nr:hypothetical protein [Cyanobacteria bacterium UBA11159]HCA97848.1 hypothetical protein [Cyanobacteria bacterium UBA9226]
MVDNLLISSILSLKGIGKGEWEKRVFRFLSSPSAPQPLCSLLGWKTAVAITTSRFQAICNIVIDTTRQIAETLYFS